MNVPLLRETLEHVAAHPEQHDQRSWGARTRCGTTHCLAGWAIVLAGMGEQLAWDPRGAGPGRGVEIVDQMSDGRDVFDAARDLLGLDDEDADLLFDSDGTLTDLWRHAAYVTDGQIVPPDTVGGPA